jgi:hypothetical protein
MRESWKQPGRWYLHKWPSRQAMASIRGKIRARTERRYARLPLQWAVEDLNRALRGWGNYFRYGNSARKFAQIDSYVNERLAILASAKHGLQGRNWVTRFNYQWATRLGIYRLTGTVKTHARVCQPVNDVGEPCAGEPHARFDAAAGGASRQSAAPCGAGRLPPTLPTGSATRPEAERCVDRDDGRSAGVDGVDDLGAVDAL